MDTNMILSIIGEIMGFLDVPTQLGRNFLDFVELMLMIIMFPFQLFGGGA